VTRPTTRIVLVYFDAGGGHRASATALQEVIQQLHLPWQVDLLNLQELLDPIDIVRKLTRIRIQDVYNNMLRNDWTLGSPQLMRVLQWTVRLFHWPTVRLLERHWRAVQPQLLASLVPHFNRALCESLAKTFPKAPFVTILTDIADYPPHFWIERQNQFLICGSDRAVQQAVDKGHPASHIFRTSGMILNPRFYGYAPVDRRLEREKRGLDPDRFTALVLFGGQGSRKKMLQIDASLGRSSLPVQLIFICGKNERLAEELRARKSPLPRLIEGFTSDVPYYMQLADFLIGKPGPASIAEALQMHLPVIVERNAWTLPQERYNTEWVRENEVGLVVPSFSAIAEAVARLLQPENFARFRSHAAAMNTRALFEIPEMLEQILSLHQAPSEPRGQPECLPQT
jgi:UDP-N-acetylglucosamine:LPS N-acetylglucosamine transferase